MAERVKNICRFSIQYLELTTETLVIRLSIGSQMAIYTQGNLKITTYPYT